MKETFYIIVKELFHNHVFIFVFRNIMPKGDDDKIEKSAYVAEFTRRVFDEMEVDRAGRVRIAPLTPLVKSKLMASTRRIVQKAVFSNRYPPEICMNELKIVDGHPNLFFLIAKGIYCSAVMASNRLRPSECVRSKHKALFSELRPLIQTPDLPWDIFLSRMQKIYDRIDGRFQIFLFDNINQRSAVFKGPKKRSHRAAIGVYVDHQKGTVYSIRYIERMFQYNKTTNFCAMCGVGYAIGQPFRHRDCPMKCGSCGRYGYQYPCEQEDEGIYCPKCNLEFPNPECYEFHLNVRGRHPTARTMCRKVRRCTLCSLKYHVRFRKGKDTHQCNVRRCGRCSEFHKRNELCHSKEHTKILEEDDILF